MKRRSFLLSSAGAGLMAGVPVIGAGQAQNHRNESAGNTVAGQAYKP